MAHDHEHCHNHAPADYGRAFAIGAALNLTFVLVEGGYGFMANSLVLLAETDRESARHLHRRIPSTQRRKPMNIKQIPLLATLLTLSCMLPGLANADNFDKYLTGFTYQERKDMKIDSKELVELLQKGEVQFIDIRFPEEYAAWHMGFAKNIPLNELPARLGELDKSKLIVTACPHYDRSSMARLYLTTKGYRARYLNDGLLGLANLLRGDAARDFTNATTK